MKDKAIGVILIAAGSKFLGREMLIPTFETLKVGANSGDLGQNLHVYPNRVLPIMGNVYINTSAAVWTVNQATDQVVLKQGGYFNVSGHIDLVDVVDSIQSNCAVEAWITKNSVQVSPYYRSNYFTRVNALNKAEISISSNIFVWSQFDTIRLMVRPVSGDTLCRVRINTTYSYLQFHKY